MEVYQNSNMSLNDNCIESFKPLSDLFLSSFCAFVFCCSFCNKILIGLQLKITELKCTQIKYCTLQIILAILIFSLSLISDPWNSFQNINTIKESSTITQIPLPIMTCVN